MRAKIVWEVFQMLILSIEDSLLRACIIVDPTNVEAIMEWPEPMNVSEVHIFMGLVG